MRFLLPFAVLFFAVTAHASSVSDLLHLSGADNSNEINATYAKPGETKSDAGFDVSADYTSTKSTTTDFLGNSAVTKSSELDLAADVDFASLWSLGAGYNIGNTQPDNLKTSEPLVSIKKKWFAGPEPADDLPGKFRASYYVKYQYARNDFSQTATYRRSTTLLGIRQTSSELLAGGSPVAWMDFETYYKIFAYDKNVDTFVAQLDTPAAVRRYGTAFSSSISSLSLNEFSLALTFHLDEKWDLALTSVRTTDAPSPHLVGTDNSFAITYNAVSGWAISLGAGREASAGTPDVGYLTAGVHYDF